MYSLPVEIHIEILDWLAPEIRQMQRLVDKYFARLIKPDNTRLLNFGAEHNLLEYCEVGLLRGDPKSRVCSISAGCGNLKILQHARSQGCPWGLTAAYAAASGHLHIIRWARGSSDNPVVCPWDKYTCANAAGYGHLELLKWLHLTGCPWDSKTCIRAAEGDHLEVLQWAMENDCPWDFQDANISECPRRIQDYLTSLRG